VLFAGLLMLTGCETTRSTSSTTDSRAAEPAASSRAAWPRTSRDPALQWSSMAFPTGDARTSALGLEKGVPREVRLGQPYDYEIIVTNLTGLRLDDVVVTESLGSNFKLNSSTPQAAERGGALTWALGDLEPNQAKTIRVNGTPTGEGAITCCASASYSSMLCSAVNVVSPKLRLVKTGPAEVTRCDDIIYTFEVANTGTGSIPNVRISDPLPTGLATVDGKRTIEFNVGTLGPNQTKRMTSTVRAEKTGRYENKATATGERGLTAESAAVATVVREPVLKIAKTGPRDSFSTSTFTYEITVSNSGDAPAKDTVLEDAVPANAAFVSASDGGRLTGTRVLWNLGTLAPAASKKVSLTLRCDTAGTVRNTATVRATCASPVSASAETEVKGIPAILLEVVDISDPIRVGDNETYEITVTNQGSAADTNIRIVATLEDNQQYVSSSGATTGSAAGQTITFQPLASLAAKQRAIWRVVVRNVKSGDVRFKVTMTSAELGRPVEETEATRVYE
jgi:uncharacterized repeat protein (TIGR01451 family)